MSIKPQNCCLKARSVRHYSTATCMLFFPVFLGKWLNNVTHWKLGESERTQPVSEWGCHLSHVLNPCVHVKQGGPCKGVAQAKLWCACEKGTWKLTKSIIQYHINPYTHVICMHVYMYTWKLNPRLSQNYPLLKVLFNLFPVLLGSAQEMASVSFSFLHSPKIHVSTLR